MTRKSKREIERMLDDIAGESSDPEAGRPIRHDLNEETKTLLDDLTSIDDPDDVYGKTGTTEWLDRMNEEHPAKEDTDTP